MMRAILIRPRIDGIFEADNWPMTTAYASLILQQQIFETQIPRKNKGKTVQNRLYKLTLKEKMALDILIVWM